MPDASWKAAPDGRYWINAVLGNLDLPVMVDLGLVDPADLVGFELEPSIYHTLKQSGHLAGYQRRSRRDASGRVFWSDSGWGTAQLFDPTARQRIGPLVRLYLSCGVAGVPNRVGVVFFHRLINCRVFWELDQRTWRIEYP